MSHGVLVLSAAIAGIALDGVDNAVFAFLHDTDMIGLPILRAGTAFIVPIEENDLTSGRFKAAVLPLPTVFEPLHPISAACEFRYHAAFNIPAFIRTPAHKTGAPFYTPVKAIPRPIGLTAHIADLRQGNGHDFAVANGDTVKHRRPERIVFLGK